MVISIIKGYPLTKSVGDRAADGECRAMAKDDTVWGIHITKIVVRTDILLFLSAGA